MIFHKLQSQALHIIKEYNLKLLQGGVGKTFTCISIQTQDGKIATGVVLTPQNEGDIEPFREDTLENLLIKGNEYDVNKRSIALCIINAVGQFCLQQKQLQCKNNLRVALSEHIHKLTCKESKIVFIGHLKPVVNALKQNERDPIVFCRQQTDIKTQVYNDIYEYEGVKDADVVVITGAAFIGSTIDALLAMCPKKAHIIVSGFSAGFDPQWLCNTSVAEVASIDLSDTSFSALLNYEIEDIFAHPCYILPTQ